MWLALVALCCFILACSGGGGGGGGGSNDPTVTALEVTPANASIAKGTTQDLTVTGILSDSTHHDMTASVTWSSSDVGVATISEGVATATGVGATTITATLDNVTSNTTITVTDAELVSIEVTPTNPGIVLGTLQQFTATGMFSDSTTQDLTTAVTWSSSSPGTATISNAAGSEGSASSVEQPGHGDDQQCGGERGLGQFGGRRHDDDHGHAGQRLRDGRAGGDGCRAGFD
jgi:hypothetical protein